MFSILLAGVFLGALLVLVVEYLIFLNPFGKDAGDPGFKEQFVPFRIPRELRQLLSGRNVDELKKKETCVGFNLIIQFLYQEFRDSRWFRRWMLKRLQMELNDLQSRTTAGRLVQHLQIRDFTVGHQFPVIRDVHVDKVQLSDDGESFEELDVVTSVEYRGGLQLSVDVTGVLGRKAHLAVKLRSVTGQARLRLARRPFTHWSFAFLREPTMDFSVDSQFQGRVIPQLVPLIIQQFRRTVRRKHVLPQFKFRYRPFFYNALLQPSSKWEDFERVPVKGLLEVTVRGASRLNVELAGALGHTEVYCILSLGAKPFSQVNTSGSTQFISLMIKLVRQANCDPTGLLFGKVPLTDRGPNRMVSIATVEKGSLAEKAGFQTGDILLAINNLAIVSERQASKLINNTIGDLAVLIDRKLANIDDEEHAAEQLAAYEINEGGGIKGILGDGGVNLGVPTKGALGRSFSKSEPDLTKLLEGETENVELGKRVEKTGVLPSAEVEKMAESPLRKVHSSIGLERCVTPDNTSSFSAHRLSLNQEFPSTTSERLVDIPAVVNADEPAYGLVINVPTLDKVTNQPNTSNSQPEVSPSLSRRQRLTAKANQMAQKWQTGKISVKDLWNRHGYYGKGQQTGQINQQQDDKGPMKVVFHKESPTDEDENLSRSFPEENCMLHIPNSKSETTSLNSKLDANLDQEHSSTEGNSESELVESSELAGQRIRSQSEPDTAVSIRNSETLENREIEVGIVVDSDNSKNSGSLEGSHKTKNSERVVASGDAKELELRPAENSENFKNSAAVLDSQNLQKSESCRLFEEKSEEISVADLAEQRENLQKEEKAVLRESGKREIMTGKLEKRTNTVPLKAEPSWLKTLSFSLGAKTKHLNVSLWSENSASRSDETTRQLLGYVTLLVPEILDDCGVTLSNYHQETFVLRPPDGHTAVPTQFQKLARNPGFDSRLCFGDLTLGFRWFPEGKPEEENSSEDFEHLQAGETLESSVSHKTTKSQGPKHRWANAHFTQAVFCRLCAKKIWLKSASQCSDCTLICHKKCQPKVDSLIECGGKRVGEKSEGGTEVAEAEVPIIVTDTTTGSADVDGSVEEGAVEAITVSMSEERKSGRWSAGTGKRLQLALTDKLSSLRRRKPATTTAETATSSAEQDIMMERTANANGRAKVAAAVDSYEKAHSNPPSPGPERKESSQSAPDESGSVLQSLLYTEGGTYNEHVIHAAKDLGRGLFAALPPDERKAKMNEQESGRNVLQSLLYTDGGTYNEHVIHAAEDLGRGLFAALPADERKAKMNEQIDRLQKEIDDATRKRLDLLRKLTQAKTAQSTEEAETESDLTKTDDNIQALAVLMLHYCAGLQHCLDNEEQAALSSNSEKDVPEFMNEKTEILDADCERETTNNNCVKEVRITEKMQGEIKVQDSFAVGILERATELVQNSTGQFSDASQAEQNEDLILGMAVDTETERDIKD